MDDEHKTRIKAYHEKSLAAYGESSETELSLQELMVLINNHERELMVLKSKVIINYFEQAPRCGWCAMPFSDGDHSSCCGGY